MLNDLKIKVLIINVEKFQFNNDKTGEVVELCKVVYAIPLENSENFVGGAIFEAYSHVKHFENVSKYSFKHSDVLLEQRPQKNGVKYYLKQVDNYKCI